VSNSARSVLLARLRRQLNEPVAANSFWTDADLNDYLLLAYQHYHRRYSHLNPEDSRIVESITYTAEAVYYDITTTGYDIERIESVMDQTGVSAGMGSPYLACTSLHDLNAVNASLGGHTMTDPVTFLVSQVGGTGTPTHWYFERLQTVAAGVITQVQRFYIAPRTAVTRSLDLYVSPAPRAFSADTHTTGLPDEFEHCIVAKASIYARKQEGKRPDVEQRELAECEVNMMSAVQSVNRGQIEVEYHDVD